MNKWIWLTAGLLLGTDWLRRAIQISFGMRSLVNVTKPQWDRLPRVYGEQPSVAVIVPARNEAENIERCLRSLLNQDYPNLQVCAVNDRSNDATGTLMDKLQQEGDDKLRVLHISELPGGWLGKTHAMWRGAAATASYWLLFTDGDVVFRSDALSRTLNYAETTQTDHLVIFPTLLMHGVGERMMLAFFGLSFSLLVRPWKVKDPGTRDYIGAGAFNLIRRGTYDALGTYRALRMHVIDDLKLGQAVKKHGFKQDCVVGHGLVSVRWAEGAFGVVHNLRKNTFSLFGFNWFLAALAIIAATIYHIGPWAGIILAPGVAKLGFVAAVCSIAWLYVGMGTQFRISGWFFLSHPLAALIFVYTLFNSAL